MRLFKILIKYIIYFILFYCIFLQFKDNFTFFINITLDYFIYYFYYILDKIFIICEYFFNFIINFFYFIIEIYRRIFSTIFSFIYWLFSMFLNYIINIIILLLKFFFDVIFDNLVILFFYVHKIFYLLYIYFYDFIVSILNKYFFFKGNDNSLINNNKSYTFLGHLNFAYDYLIKAHFKLHDFKTQYLKILVRFDDGGGYHMKTIFYFWIDYFGNYFFIIFNQTFSSFIKPFLFNILTFILILIVELQNLLLSLLLLFVYFFYDLFYPIIWFSSNFLKLLLIFLLQILHFIFEVVFPALQVPVTEDDIEYESYEHLVLYVLLDDFIEPQHYVSDLYFDTFIFVDKIIRGGNLNFFKYFFKIYASFERIFFSWDISYEINFIPKFIKHPFAWSKYFFLYLSDILSDLDRISWFELIFYTIFSNINHVGSHVNLEEIAIGYVCMGLLINLCFLVNTIEFHSDRIDESDFQTTILDFLQSVFKFLKNLIKEIFK